MPSFCRGGYRAPGAVGMTVFGVVPPEISREDRRKSDLSKVLVLTTRALLRPGIKPRRGPILLGASSGMWQEWEHWLQAHTAIALWLAAGGTAANTMFRYLPRLLLELIAIRARDPATRAVCLETIRLRRRDAASLPTYLNPSAAGHEPAGGSSATPACATPACSRCESPSEQAAGRRPGRIRRARGSGVQTH